MSQRIAIVDPGSFVLPYDFQLVKALAARGEAVDFFGSTTRYNGELLDAMRRLPAVAVHARAVSSSVAARWKGAVAYLALLVDLLWRSPRYAIINLQFSGWWPAEWLVFALLQRKFVFTVHNAVPHGFASLQHGPTRRLARLAKALVFVSEWTRDDFLRRYGEAFRAKSSVLPHGLLPVEPDAEPTPYVAAATPVRELVFWGRVEAYKGVELFAELARSAEVRRRGLMLAVYGAWAQELHALRDELFALGVQVHDAYLDETRLASLLSRNAVFLLPYQRASQSGALYSLLAHGRLFVCADTGDLGAFMRRAGLQTLLLRERSAEAVLACLDHLEAQPAEVAQAFGRAQQAHRWDHVMAESGQVYLRQSQTL